MTGAPAKTSCAFCLRGRGAVKNLIQGPGAIMICDDCVETAKGPHVSGLGTTLEAKSCAFCLKGRDRVDLLLLQGTGGADVCHACVEICHEILVKEGVRKA